MTEHEKLTGQKPKQEDHYIVRSLILPHNGDSILEHQDFFGTNALIEAQSYAHIQDRKGRANMVNVLRAEDISSVPEAHYIVEVWYDTGENTVTHNEDFHGENALIEARSYAQRREKIAKEYWASQVHLYKVESVDFHD